MLYICFVQSRVTDISRKHLNREKSRPSIPTLLIIDHEMPPLRTPLGCISGNRFKGCEISPYLRGKIAGKASLGLTAYKIAKDLKLVTGTVRYTILQDELRDEGHSLPRKPRNLSYTEHDERVLLRHVRLNPKDTYKQVIIACGLNCKTSMVKKILKKYGIAN